MNPKRGPDTKSVLLSYGVCSCETQSLRDQLERANHPPQQIGDRYTVAAGMAHRVTVVLSRVQLLLEP